MPVYRIPEDELIFPEPGLSEPSGLLGVGGDLRPERLLLAYANGIFPWYSEGQPILWFSPDPRCVLEPKNLHVAYCRLHEIGHAHSVEVWSGQTLVGGLYGVALGKLFAGESMFSRASDTSKTALVWLVRQLGLWGFEMVDAQIRTYTLMSMGAVELERTEYLERIQPMVRAQGRIGRWTFDPDFDPSYF